jgi:predicted GH43/DUF377 family glycosyl hydrolase
MFRWNKLGKVFDPTAYPDKPWLRGFAQGPATLVFDDYVRVYFSCRPKPDANGSYVSNSAWVDLDRRDLRRILRVADKPILERGGYGEFDEFGIYPVSPIRNGNEVWLYYAGWTRCESVPFNVAIGLAKSTDRGTTFRKHGRGPVLSYSLDEPFVLSGPKIRRFNDRFYLFYIAGTKWLVEGDRPEPVYKIRLATSHDGLSWDKANAALIPDVLGEEEAQASPDVFFAEGKYHMFFCYRHGRDYRNAERGYRIGYAYSKDLLNWTRDDAKAGLLPSREGWDAEMVSYPHLCEIDGKVYMFYLGDGVGRWGFGLAELEGGLA